MKFGLLLVSMLLAGAVQANYTYHDYDGALRGIALDNACVTSSEVRTIKPAKHCASLKPVEHGGNGEEGTWTEWVCVKWELSMMAFPRAFDRTVCTEWSSANGEGDVGCVQTGTVKDFLPATIKVGYVTTGNGDAGDDFPGVTKMFTFPACK